jgi:hypothetical protein
MATDKLISVERYKRVLEGFREKLIMSGKEEAAEAVKTLIKGLKIEPTVDAVEVVHGRWVEHKLAEEENGLLISNYECSNCHSWERNESDYCPNCGASMKDGDTK